MQDEFKDQEEFESIKQFAIYFPHNNIENIIRKKEIFILNQVVWWKRTNKNNAQLNAV